MPILNVKGKKMNNQININDTDKAVAEFLKTNHIHFSVNYCGTDRPFESNNKMDSWSVKIGTQSFDFYTGIGHRIAHNKNAYKLSTKQIEVVTQLRDLLGKDRLDNTVFKLADQSTYAVSPTQASVLYCLLLDAQGAEQNFYDWCMDYGYDNDSRKAFETYESCCKTLGKIRKIFNTTQRQQLSELLEDY